MRVMKRINPLGRRLSLLLSALVLTNLPCQGAEPSAVAELREGRPMSVSLEGGVHDLGFTYSFTSDNSDNFHSISIFLDMQGLSVRKVEWPGGFLRYDYHFTLYNQHRVLLYAGPGAALGYVTDSDEKYGITFGLAGNVGVKYMFDRHLSLGASLHPVFGYNLNWEGERQRLNFYEAGLWRSILPEISLSYTFGKQLIKSSPDELFPRCGQTRKRAWSLGLEAAFQPSVYMYRQSMFYSSDGYRSYEMEDQPLFYACGGIFLTAGWHFSEQYKLGLALGYAGVRPDVRIHEMLLRNQWYFKPINAQGDRFFVSLDAGVGLKASDWGRPYAVGKVSCGYSLKISADSAVEFFIRNGHCFATPTLYENDEDVPPERSLRSRLYITNVALGISLDL